MRTLFYLSLVVLSLLRPDIVHAQGTGVQHFVPWEKIQEADINSKTRIWREIEVQSNPALFSSPKETLLSVLKEGIKSGKIKAYDAANDRFTREIKAEDIPAGLAARPVVKWYIKEDELLVKDKAETVVRILGLAPVVQVADKDGKPVDMPLLWIYYPDCREYLSSFSASDMYSWDEVFNGRHFKARLTSFK